MNLLVATFVVASALALTGCPAGTNPAPIIAGGATVCEVVLTATDPVLAPLCATAAEVATAISQLLEENAAARKAATPPTRDDIYQRVLKNRIAKMAAPLPAAPAK